MTAQELFDLGMKSIDKEFKRRKRWLTDKIFQEALMKYTKEDRYSMNRRTCEEFYGRCCQLSSMIDILTGYDEWTEFDDKLMAKMIEIETELDKIYNV